jgi:SAM-dependent methyltransferase
MPAWFETMEDRFWLHPDDVGGEEARFIVSALSLRPGDAVLDAPCGAGRISLHLAEAGCIVSGVDLRATFIRRARRRFRAAGLHGTFRVLDLRRLDMEGQFDAILSWSGSFGYFSEAENARLVGAYARALRPGGRLLIEQPDREQILRHFQRVMRIGSSTVRNRWDARNQRVMSRRFESGVEDRRNSSSMRLYTPAQIRGLFERQGLIVERVYRSLAFGNEHGRSVPRRVMVGRSPCVAGRARTESSDAGSLSSSTSRVIENREAAR